MTPPASPPPGSPRLVEAVIEPPTPMVLPEPIAPEPESEPSSASYDIQAELQRLAGWYSVQWAKLQIRWGIEDISKIIFLICQQKHML